MLKKLMIVPWFGPLPSWFPYWKENFDRLAQYGYDLLMPRDVNEFKARARRIFDVDCPAEDGKAKAHDYRPTFGELYQDDLKGYDFYGHTDLDCCYGKVDNFVTEALLESCDIHSNHRNYICGPWTLYRNVKRVNTLFLEYPKWREELEGRIVSGWIEAEYSQIVDRHATQGLRLKYTHWQGKDPMVDENLNWRGESLYDGNDEIMMSHFRHLKRWPNALQGRDGF